MEPIALVLAAAVITVPAMAESVRLIEFRDQADVDAWRPVHDGVMGGVSGGSSALVGEVARFQGRVSLANNGGFASFRRAIRLPDLSDYNGLRLRVRGDGQVYKLSLRTDGGWNGVGWQAPFATRAGEWETIDLSFKDLVPMWRGSVVRDAGRFDPSSIREVGLVIADKQEGAFVLDLFAIDSW